MKLIFSPYYDNGAYLSRECIMGEKSVGPIGLLAELELRTGTVGKSESESIRSAHYLNAMKQVEPAGRFYEKSFSRDPLGVAAELLSWRDSLVTAGWNENISGVSKKLDDLAEIEKNFHCEGIADRWRNILHVLSKEDTRLSEDLEIEVRMRETLLEPYLKDVLSAVSRKGYMVHYEEEEDSNKLNTLVAQDKVRIVPFLDIYEATEWASWHLGDVDAVINKDNLLLNNYLASEGKAELRSEDRACNGELLQIFKLTYNSLKEPKDIRDIIAFLSLEKNPIDGKLTNQLSYQLTRDGGFSEECMKIIEDFRNDNSIEKKKKERSIFFVDLLTENRNKEGIPSATLAECNKRLSKWVNGSIAILKEEIALLKKEKNRKEEDKKATLQERQKSELLERKETEKSELHSLEEFLKAMQILIDGAERTVRYSDLENWVKFIYKPQNIVFRKAEKNSVDTVCDIRSIAEPVGKVLWADCTGTDEYCYAYSFLSKLEIKRLYDNGVLIPGKDLFAQAHNNALQSGLNRIEKLTLTVPAFGNGEKLLEHPLITEIKTMTGKDEEPEAPSEIEAEAFTKEEKHVEKPQKKYHYQLKDIDTKLLKREYESYSSLNDLIQFPFEYVLKYFANITENESLKDLNRTKGDAAHKYIEMLFNKAKADCADKPENITATAKSLNTADEQAADHPMAEKAIQEVGLILDTEENSITKTSFLEQLYKSADALTEILHKNHLQFIGSEMKKQTINLSEINTIQDGKELMNAMQAKMDFVCKDSKGNIYIIDFKWSKEKNYTEKLQNSQDLQLAYYKKTVELPGEGLTGNVAAYGYFLLTCGTLLIPEEYDGLLKGDHIKSIKRKDSSITAKEILELAFGAYKDRIEQIKEGKIEEAEGMELDKADSSKDYFPFLPDNKSTKNKRYSIGHPNKSIKGDLK